MNTKKNPNTHKHQSKAHQCKKKQTTKQSKDSPQNIRIIEMTESSLIFTFLFQKQCKEFNGVIVKIDDKKENDFIHKLVAKTGKIYFYYFENRQSIVLYVVTTAMM